MDEPVTLEFLGRKLIENQESMEILTAIVRRIDANLLAVITENRALLRREARAAPGRPPGRG